MPNCANCGEYYEGEKRYCANCGQSLSGFDQSQFGDRPFPPYRNDYYRDIPNFLAPAILVTIFCCVPAGIPAIVYAAQVNGKLAAGDYEGALSDSNKARTWCWIAFGGGLLALFFGIISAV